MSTLIIDDTTVAVKAESTEGTYAPPTGATDGYVEALKGVEMNPSRALVERNIMARGLAKATPRLSIKAGAAKIGVELKGSGTEGSAPDYAPTLEALFGTVRTVATTTTTKASGNTASSLKIEDADITKFTLGDIFVVKETGNYHIAAVGAITGGAGTWAITPTPICPFTPSNSVVISKSKTYVVADSGHPSLSIHTYWGDGFLEKMAGCRPSSMTLGNFKTGQIPTLEFNYEAMKYDRTASTAPGYTPTYSAALPAVALDAKVYQDGTEISVDEVSITWEQVIGFLTATGDSNGRTAGRVSGKRNIRGSFAPYAANDSIANFTAFNTLNDFSLFLRIFNPSSVSGEFELGSVIGIWLPSCILTSNKVADQEGVVVERLEFMATGGTTGASKEIYMGFI